MNHYFYARTSTDHQDNGMEDQVERLAAWARQHDVPANILTEQASGKTRSRRPVLKGILDAMGEGDLIIVTTLSRLTRSSLDFGNILEQAKQGDWGIAVLDMDLNTSTATGRLIAGILMNVFQWEREAIGERVRAGLAVVKASGVQLGHPSTVPESTKEHILALRTGGMAWQGIADELNSTGVPTPSGRGKWHQTNAKRHIAEAPDA